MKKKLIKSNRGGKRIGSGRKKGIETTTISFRVPKLYSERLTQEIKLLIKSLNL